MPEAYKPILLNFAKFEEIWKIYYPKICPDLDRSNVKQILGDCEGVRYEQIC